MLGLDEARLTRGFRARQIHAARGHDQATRQLLMSATPCSTRASFASSGRRRGGLLRAPATSSWAAAARFVARAGSRSHLWPPSSGRRSRGPARQVLEKVRRAIGADDRLRPPVGKAFNDYTFGTHALEVEIDEETGARA